ncbi:MAG: hypothetical protein ACRD4S_11795 [Candidatus Acidiferrales bacterium]
MLTEQKSDRDPCGLNGAIPDSGAGGERIGPQSLRGFRRWMAEEQGFLRTLLLIATYLSLALFVLSLIVFGGPNLMSEILLAVFVGSLLGVYFLFQFRYRVDASGRVAWRWYQTPYGGRAKRVLTSALWTVIAIVLIVAALYARAHIHR